MKIPVRPRKYWYGHGKIKSLRRHRDLPISVTTFADGFAHVSFTCKPEEIATFAAAAAAHMAAEGDGWRDSSPVALAGPRGWRRRHGRG